MYLIHSVQLKRRREMILAKYEKIDRIKECTNELEGINETIIKQDEDSNRLYQILQKYTGTRENRNKRTLLPFTGKASKYLFWTMDEEEGDELLQKIKIARQNNEKVAALLANTKQK
jgi:hypothetical protein